MRAALAMAAIALVALAAAQVTTPPAPVSGCSALWMKACKASAHCSWCGNNTDQMGHPIGTCYNPRTDNASCCMGPAGGAGGTPSCSNGAPRICHGHDTCQIDTISTHYGDCYEATCCPPHLPVSCRGRCYPAGKVCCGTAVCDAGKLCCKDMFQAGVCCDSGPEKSQCCGANWNLYCCGKGLKCGDPYNVSNRCLKP
jgi:hypothetical protein